MDVGDTRARLEQRLLTISIAATLAVSASGVAFGALTGSFSILFDGVYAGIDAAMSGLALAVARLIQRDATGDAPLTGRRFQFGFWHVEPMVLAMNGLMLTLAALYALAGSVLVILDGGRAPDFGWAVIYAVFVLTVCLGMAWWEGRMNRLARSAFVALDARAWLMSGAITGALLVAFLAGLAAQGTAFDLWTPYIDPGVLALVCLAILPLPLRSTWQALGEVLGLSPDDLDNRVRAAATAAVAAHGLSEFRSYVARAGRASMIEIHFVGRPGWNASLDRLDAIREALSTEIGGAGPHRWLTVSFTARPDWAE